MKVTEIHPYLRKRYLTRFVYWLSMKVEEYADYKSPCSPESIRYRILTRTWEALLELSLWLYRRSRHGGNRGHTAAPGS